MRESLNEECVRKVKPIRSAEKEKEEKEEEEGMIEE